MRPRPAALPTKRPQPAAQPEVLPLDANATYSLRCLKRCGIGRKIWRRLVDAGMPVDLVGNRVFQRGAVVREWLGRVAEMQRREKAGKAT